jgi:ubiquinone biosynthesis protein UbiJ
MIDDTSPPAAGTRLLEAFAGVIEGAIGRVLRLDPAGSAALGPLEGRTLRLSLAGAPRGLRLHIADGRVRPVPDEGAAADLALSLTPDGIREWLSRPAAERGLPPGTRIEGDLELARVVERAISAFEPDLELPFVELFGGTLGPQLARGVAGVAGWARRQARELAASSAEFVTEEARLAAARAEIDDFNADVDMLRDDVERLEARVARLMRGAGAP